MTAPLPFRSSGDLIADRRYRWAIDQLAEGDLTAAAEILLQAIEIAPDFAAAWFALGVIRDRQGNRDTAITAFERARAGDPDDLQGAGLQLARLGVGEATPDMASAYVRRLFDQQALVFDEALAHLAYQGPTLLLAAVKRFADEPMRIGTMLDLGCGTGLAGAAFRPHVVRLTGIDLSTEMIEAARAKGIYDRLQVGELLHFLMQEAATSARYDLVLAADVFVYLNDLGPIAAAAAHVLAERGLFAFTVETHRGDGVVWQETLRYAHGTVHVREALAAASLEVRLLEPVATRTENHKPVPGLLAVAARHSPR